MQKIIINDKSNFYFGHKAEIIETNVLNGLTIHRFMIKTPTGGEITGSIRDSEIIRK